MTFASSGSQVRFHAMRTGFSRSGHDNIADEANVTHTCLMLPDNAALRITMICSIAALAACDPGVHLAVEQDFDNSVDYDCVEKALRVVAKDVRRGSYQADGYGPRGFPKGLTVTQFNYSDSSLAGGYTLDLALLPNGKTHYWHEWGKIGTKIATEERAHVSPLLIAANHSVAQRCGLNFKMIEPKVGDG